MSHQAHFTAKLRITFASLTVGRVIQQMWEFLFSRSRGFLFSQCISNESINRSRSIHHHHCSPFLILALRFRHEVSSQRSGLPGTDGRALLLLRLRALDVQVQQLQLGAGEALKVRLQVLAHELVEGHDAEDGRLAHRGLDVVVRLQFVNDSIVQTSETIIAGISVCPPFSPL